MCGKGYASFEALIQVCSIPILSTDKLAVLPISLSSFRFVSVALIRVFQTTPVSSALAQ